MKKSVLAQFRSYLSDKILSAYEVYSTWLLSLSKACKELPCSSFLCWVSEKVVELSPADKQIREGAVASH